ncbi:MAG: hypothetical protein DRP68_06800 [Candidatus Omnitrophota bacterium]|nr:MAG: hypothetical protein DRP68_06800 [Candidatus Omnitrophota bacterium]RKY43898.1 MAG: hypothetical protein DRP81_06335 [Candidatus Omnitrophota bacterium]
MSTIYDALKKIEKKPFQSSPVKFKKKLVIFLSGLGVVCLVSLVVYLKINRSKLTKDSAKKTTNSKTVISREISQKRKKQKKTYILEGIIYDEKAPLAMINGRMVKEKDKIDNLEVIEISPNSVKLLNLEDKTVLTLSF